MLAAESVNVCFIEARMAAEGRLFPFVVESRWSGTWHKAAGLEGGDSRRDRPGADVTITHHRMMSTRTRAIGWSKTNAQAAPIAPVH